MLKLTSQTMNLETPTTAPSRRSKRKSTALSPVYTDEAAYRKACEQAREQFTNSIPKQHFEKPQTCSGLILSAEIPVNDNQPTPKTYVHRSGRCLGWHDFLSKASNVSSIAPVNYFKHAPLSSVWKDIAKIGLKVEVPNPFIIANAQIYWVGTILHYAGYRALVLFESFQVSPPHIEWINFCNRVAEKIGYCAENKIALHPPTRVSNIRKDFSTKLQGILQQGYETIQDDHYIKVKKEISSASTYQLNQIVEIVDKYQMDRVRLGRVTGIICDRIHATYIIPTMHQETLEHFEDGFWFNTQSDLVHPLGWSHTIGHEIYSIPSGIKLPTLDSSYFTQIGCDYPNEIQIEVGMLLELRHPFTPYEIVPGEIYKVLQYGYFMVHTLPDNAPFCFHVMSPYILNCGWSNKNKLPISFEENEERTGWVNYYKGKNNQKLNLEKRPKFPRHKFKVGMKMEAIDICQPTFCGPATVKLVIDHLLFIHFDGYPTNPEYHQWTHADSPDIYPVGWSEITGHDFQSHPENVIFHRESENERPSTSAAIVSDKAFQQQYQESRRHAEPLEDDD